MHRFALALFAMVAAASPAQSAPELHRGVGVHEWLNWAPLAEDGSYRRPPYRSIAEWLGGARPITDWPPTDPFQTIRSLGFDFVRLSVDPGPLLASTGTERQEALDVLKAAVSHILDADLTVVFDLHAVTQKPEHSLAALEDRADSYGALAYRAMVTDVAGMLVTLDLDKVALEPFNEPGFYPCEGQGSGEWQKMMRETVATIRSVSANLAIVATGACGGDITGLVDLDPDFDDPNIVYSFHMYEPHSFTHQRLDDPKAFGSGLPWPADTSSPELVLETLRARMDAAGISDVEQTANLLAVQGIVDQYFRENWGNEQLEDRFAEALDWASEHSIPPERLFMGEFGAILISEDGRMGAYNADRLRYLEAVRTQAEAHGIAWSMWEFSNPYGMTLIEPKGPAIPDTDMLDALGLSGQ